MNLLPAKESFKRLACVHEICSVHEYVNDTIKVNVDRLPPREVERLLMDKLRALLGEVFPEVPVEFTQHHIPDRGIDFIAKIQVPEGPALEFLVECKSQPRPSLVPKVPGGIYAPNLTSGSKSARSWIFAAPFVSPRLAEVCWEQGWGWLDLAGNCRIAVPGLFYVDRKGNAPVHQLSRPDANLGTAEAAQVLRALLRPGPEALRWKSQRELQNATEPGVSLGLVNKIVAHLRGEGFLASDDRDGLRVVDPEKLLFAWRDAYRFDRIPRLELFTLLKAPEIEKIIREVNMDNPANLAWAVFSAAERQAPMVRQPKYWLMAAEESPESLREMLQAKSVDTGANLTLLTAPDRGYLADADHKSALAACTSPLQTYLDTWHAGGRGQEAAEAILDQELRPKWKQLATI